MKHLLLLSRLSFVFGGKSYINKIYRNKYSRHAAGAQAERGCGASGRGYAHARNTNEHICYAAKRAHAALAISGIRR